MRPSLKAPPVGMLVLGNIIGVTEYTVNSDGCWVKLDQSTMEKYCFNIDVDAWSLAIDQRNVLYLGNINESVPYPNDTPDSTGQRKNKRGFNFSYKSNEKLFAFSPSRGSTSSGSPTSTNPFVFGETASPGSPKLQKKETTSTTISKWFLDHAHA